MTRRWTRIAVALAAALTLAAPAAATATSRFAKPGGSNTGACTTVATACEIHRALQTVAQAGDGVQILPGTYTLATPITVTAPNVLIYGDAGARPDISVASKNANDNAFELSSGSTLLHVRFTDLATDSNGISALSNNLVSEVEAIGGAASQNVIELGDGSSLRNSIVRSSVDGMILVEARGIAAIRNSTLVADGTSTYGASAFVGASDTHNADLDVKNTIVATQSDAGSADLHTTSAAAGQSSFLGVSYSNYRTAASDGISGGGVAPEGNNQDDAPQFVDAAAHDFHQNPGAPTIDKGTEVPDIGFEDFDGDDRVVGATVDIGADEFLPLLKPRATTGTARAVAARRATLHGSANPRRRATAVVFQFGRTKAYGRHTPAQAIGRDNQPVPVSADLAGLATKTTFHYRLKATNAVGSAFGLDRVFTTGFGPGIPKKGACANRRVGTAGNDTLTGTAFGDRLVGLAGKDTLRGGGAADCLNGNKGRDTYFGGAGNDTIAAADGTKETVDCGSGAKDEVTADKGDTVRHCEKVTRAG